MQSLKDTPDLIRARPLLCSDRTGELVVIGGNMRLRAAQELGWTDVPVIVIKGLSEAQEIEWAVKDNGAFGQWDFDLLSDLGDLPLVDWGVEFPEGWDAPPLKVLESDGQGMSGSNYGDKRSDKVPINILGIGGMIDRGTVERVRTRLIDDGASEEVDNCGQLTRMLACYLDEKR